MIVTQSNGINFQNVKNKIILHIKKYNLCICHWLPRQGGPRAYLRQCGDFEINTSPCIEGNVGKYRYTIPTPAGVNAGTFARQWRLGMQENIFIL